MPFRKYLGVELWSPTGHSDTTLIGTINDTGNIHIRKEPHSGDICISIDTINEPMLKDRPNGKNILVEHLTKASALALSHELRKLAIGV